MKKKKRSEMIKKNIKRKRDVEVIDVSDDNSDCCIVESASKKGNEPKG